MMNHLKGAAYYCFFGPDNLNKDNEDQKKCSCYCADNGSYYDTSTGITAFGDFTRANWDNPPD